ncbi:MAG TPA: NDP-sugar synthase [Gemmatimonadales bacterium]|nr:NDP-sugar synthase [Gemmatimonadales bacterium]
MKALLLAAGEGQRLRPLTADRPKPMVPVAGTPMIAYGLSWLRANGVTEVAINTHYKPESIIRFVGDGSAFGLSVRYSPEPTLLGSSGALAPLRDFLYGPDPFVIAYGDVLTDLRLEPVLAAHREAGADATIVLTKVDDPRRAGMVELNDGGWVRRLIEKPGDWPHADAWANAGIYVLGPRVWDFVPAEGFHDFAFNLFPALLDAGGRVLGVPSDALVIDIGSHERLAAAGSLVESGRLVAPRAA